MRATGLARPVRLRVSTDEAAFGAHQPAACLHDGLARREQVEPHHAAVKAALRPGSAPHPQLRHMLVGELGERRHRAGRRMHRHFARGILATGPVVVARTHCSPILPHMNARLSTDARNCYLVGTAIEGTRGEIALGLDPSRRTIARKLLGAGAHRGSTYVRQT